jgi:hypothetical protein
LQQWASRFQVEIARIEVRTMAAGENETVKECSFRLGVMRLRSID